VPAPSHSQPAVVARGRRYLMDEAGFGLFEVSPGGRSVTCAPPRIPAWRWQRHLFGRVLPFASALRGLEPWHAGGVAVDGGGIALAGDAGAGKSSLASALVLEGGTLLSDDVLALSAVGSEVLAHPGPALMSLRNSTLKRLGAQALRKLGCPIGADSSSVRLTVPRQEHAVRLSAVYLLESVPARRRASLTEVDAPDPRRLLASTFVFALTSRERLARQLDVCAAIARSIRVVHAATPIGFDPRRLASQLLGDYRGNQG
jgi:hypothetical protein